MIDLRLGDCLEVMRAIPDGSVDMVLCDLPYGTTACKWDTVIPFEPLWEQYRRVTKPNAAIVLTACQPFTAALVMSNPKEFRHEWIWQKSRATGHLDCKRRPLRKHESALVFAKSGPRYSPQMRLGSKHSRGGARTGPAAVWGKFTDRRTTEADTYYPTSVIAFACEPSPAHPTQKPVALMEYLIRTYTSEGETVLDNCFGSGTSAVACLNTGRNCIGIERDETYFGIASRRIAAAQSQLAL